MPSHLDSAGDHCPNRQPSFSRLDRMKDVPRSGGGPSNTGFREWLRKITSNENGLMQETREQERLMQVKSFLGSLFGTRIANWPPRDLRLYLRLVSASQLATIKELRFDCFDLMCRRLTEPVAVRKLAELDRLLHA